MTVAFLQVNEEGTAINFKMLKTWVRSLRAGSLPWITEPTSAATGSLRTPFFHLLGIIALLALLREVFTDSHFSSRQGSAASFQPISTHTESLLSVLMPNVSSTICPTFLQQYMYAQQYFTFPNKLSVKQSVCEIRRQVTHDGLHPCSYTFHTSLLTSVPPSKLPAGTGLS